MERYSASPKTSRRGLTGVASGPQILRRFMATYLIVDTETGGFDPQENSLLTMYMAALDDQFNVIESVDMLIQHDVYRVTAEAMGVNKINLITHHAMATPVPVAKTILENFINRHKPVRGRLILTGHNPGFDKDFINETFQSNIWDQAVSFHMLDTVTLGVYLKAIGKLPKGQSLALGALAKAVGAEIGPAHTAKGDVDTTISILRKVIIEKSVGELISASPSHLEEVVRLSLQINELQKEIRELKEKSAVNG